ncbi:hypothetical protein ABZX12_04325 [Kribbella sp. NPDC003505]|uniref:hypothetical protein n=1 Tax=Kribbella sp. NPDC003505 TaxID=3154448 RepID=UPI0033B54FA6
MLLLQPYGNGPRDPAVRADLNELAFSWLCALCAAAAASMLTNFIRAVWGHRKGYSDPTVVLGASATMFVLGGLAAYFG